MLLDRPNRRRSVALAVLLTVFGIVSTQTAAHVQGFGDPVDFNMPPLSLTAVITPMFLLCGLAIMILVTAGGLVDSAITQRLPRRLWQSPRLEIVEALLIRLGVCGYAVCLWDKTVVVPWEAGTGRVVLTPGLLDQAYWIGLLQIVVALLLVFRRTCLLAALGVAVLCSIGIVRYGVFHMADYTYFLGLICYLALSAPSFDRHPNLRRWRVPLLVGSLGFSLMWTAIGTFLYPTWTGFLLAAHPNLTMGLPIPFITVTAGFVEFSLAFYLLICRSLLRLDAIVLMVIFVAAMPDFSESSWVTHVPIVDILLVVALHGSTFLQRAIWPRRARPVRSAAVVAGLYFASVAAMMVLYYGLQWTDGWG